MNCKNKGDKEYKKMKKLRIKKNKFIIYLIKIGKLSKNAKFSGDKMKIICKKNKMKFKHYLKKLLNLKN